MKRELVVLQLQSEDSKSQPVHYATVASTFLLAHTVPQHRQYLSYDGVGHGTPTQRWQQYQQHRLQHAVDRVHDYRVGKRDASSERTLVLKDATLARQYKTTQAIERLVEDLIQESMARGEFNNLPGSGKPLKFAPENPYVDSTTRKLNEVLITNGYVPEWVMLEREIAEEKRRLRSALSERRSHLGPSPLTGDEQCLWQEAVRSLESAAAQINRKIDKFNMVVPLLSKQQGKSGGASRRTVSLPWDDLRATDAAELHVASVKVGRIYGHRSEKSRAQNE
ncbi:hypothetical protein HPB49_001059 [Dermacentor silvarum]|uniref:Uncharacterized protein n=1 Tax=Dermacentor silvarum TaxID=543639 RepID=A0ACB8D1Q6_DERSI|nr:hypothetical protein HPB49_001059 [Dermacentor silvarum]